MRRFLFPRLTQPADDGSALFGALVAEARQPHWFTTGGVPDTLDGRFAILAAIVALATVRLERAQGEAGKIAVLLVERFVDAMDAEHRQLGMSDPGIGKQVRKLVTALGRRVEDWRAAIESGAGFDAAAKAAVYRTPADPDAADHTVEALRALWQRLEASPPAALAEGRIA